jgi:hypothetical protein
MTSQIPASFPVLLDESFFKYRLKDPTHQLTCHTNKGITIYICKKSSLASDKNNLMMKIQLLFQELKTKDVQEFVRQHVAKIKCAFIGSIAATNVQTLYHFICSPKQTPSPSSVTSNESGKRSLSVPFLPNKKRSAVHSPIPPTIDALMSALESQQNKGKVFTRQNYLEAVPADFFFIVSSDQGERKIGVHRSVLYYYEYWVNLFQSGMIESQNHEMGIKEVHPDIFEMMLDFLYHRHLEYFDHNLDQPLHLLENVYSNDCQIYQELNHLAEKYQLSTLQQFCQKRLRKLHKCLSQWHKLKNPQISKTSFAGEAQEKINLERVFKQQLSPYLELIYQEQSILLLSFEQATCASPLSQPGGFFEPITLTDSTTKRTVIFYGNRVILAGRNAYFHHLIYRQNCNTTFSSLPPPTILQGLAFEVLSSTQTIDLKGHIRANVFDFLIEILQRNSSEKETELAQLANSVTPMEFPYGWQAYCAELLGRALTQTEIFTILRYFGQFIRGMSCSFANEAEAVMGMDSLQYCPQIKKLVFENSTISIDSILGSCKELHTLKFRRCHLQIAKLPQEYLPSSLEFLQIDECSISQPEVWTFLANYASKLSTLITDDFATDLYSLQMGEAFIQFFKSINKLEGCSLFWLSENTIKRLCESEANLTHLTTPEPNEHCQRHTSCNWSDETVLLLFSRCPLLTEFCLSDFNSALKEATILTLIDQHEGLESLYLNGIPLTDRVLEHIGKKCKQLQFFDSDNTNDFTFEGYDRMISQLPHLQWISTELDEEEITELAEKYPHVKFACPDDSICVS